MNKNSSLEIIVDSPTRRTPRNNIVNESVNVKEPEHVMMEFPRSQLQEFVIFQILLHTSHLLLSWYINKSAVNICNDTVFLTISATAIYYLSFPWMIWDRYQQKFYQKLERKPYLKTCPCSMYTDSVLYLTSFCFSIMVLLFFDYPPWNQYVLSTWTLELWGIFVLNTVLTLPVVCYNFKQSYMYGELSYHLAGYLVIIFFLFFPYLIHTDINIPLHHWFLFFYLSLFSRFPVESQFLRYVYGSFCTRY